MIKKRTPTRWLDHLEGLVKKNETKEVNLIIGIKILEQIYYESGKGAFTEFVKEHKVIASISNDKTFELRIK